MANSCKQRLSSIPDALTACDLVDVVVRAPPGTGKTTLQNALHGSGAPISLFDTDHFNRPEPYEEPGFRTKPKYGAFVKPWFNISFYRLLNPCKVNILLTNIPEIMEGFEGVCTIIDTYLSPDCYNHPNWCQARDLSDEQLQQFREWQKKASERPTAVEVDYSSFSSLIHMIARARPDKYIYRVSREPSGSAEAHVGRWYISFVSERSTYPLRREAAEQFGCEKLSSR